MYFELFYHLVRRSQFNPKQYLFSLDSLTNYFGHSSKKYNHPRRLPQQGFCTSLQIWDELSFTWQTIKQRAFFAISGAIKFKHFKHLFMTLSGLGWLTMCELPRRVSYFVSSLLQNYFSGFIQDFWSSPSFLAFKTSISSSSSSTSNI